MAMTKKSPVAGSPHPYKIPRRKEWRFDLPLTAAVAGELPLGKKFREEARIRDISSTGAYLFLEANIIIGARLNLVIALPRKATEGKKLLLKIEGIVVRVEKPRKSSKKQGVAVRFTKDYSFVDAPKKA
ncbi:MAG: PilZ domain-containing protein [Candidatus Aminicenantales bacterium]